VFRLAATAAEFEHLLASNPDASETWIRYMDYHLCLADAARAEAGQAFARISFREEEEKLNVWTALLALELKYGSEDALADAVERAGRQNNPKRVYLRVYEMLEWEVGTAAPHKRAEATERADRMLGRMCKKFWSKKTEWLAHTEYLMKQSRHMEAKDVES